MYLTQWMASFPVDVEAFVPECEKHRLSFVTKPRAVFLSYIWDHGTSLSVWRKVIWWRVNFKPWKICTPLCVGIKCSESHVCDLIQIYVNSDMFGEGFYVDCYDQWPSNLELSLWTVKQERMLYKIQWYKKNFDRNGWNCCFVPSSPFINSWTWLQSLVEWSKIIYKLFLCDV